MLVNALLTQNVDGAKLVLNELRSMLDLRVICNVGRYDQSFAAEAFNLATCGFEAFGSASDQGDASASFCKFAYGSAPDFFPQWPRPALQMGRAHRSSRRSVRNAGLCKNRNTLTGRLELKHLSRFLAEF